MSAETDRIVLAQPTRARLFSLLMESTGPVATAELAELAGMHPNGIRNHLERLARAGLVERTRSSDIRRGRPRDEWTTTEAGIAAQSALTGEEPVAGPLAQWLARAYPSDQASLRRIEVVGREAGREIPLRTDGDPRHAFLEALDRLGFDPEAEEVENGFECRLGRCPYLEAARENQEAVCALHRGMTQGLLETLDPALQLGEFTPRDPETAGCLIGVGAGAGTPPD